MVWLSGKATFSNYLKLDSKFQLNLLLLSSLVVMLYKIFTNVQFRKFKIQLIVMAIYTKVEMLTFLSLIISFIIEEEFFKNMKCDMLKLRLRICFNFSIKKKILIKKSIMPYFDEDVHFILMKEDISLVIVTISIQFSSWGKLWQEEKRDLLWGLFLKSGTVLEAKLDGVLDLKLADYAALPFHLPQNQLQQGMQSAAILNFIHFLVSFVRNYICEKQTFYSDVLVHICWLFVYYR